LFSKQAQNEWLEKMSETYRLLIHSARQIVQICSNKQKLLKGQELKSLKILVAKPADGLSIVADQ